MLDFIVALLLSQQETPVPPSAPEPPKSEVHNYLDRITGTIRLSYRYRSTGDESDSDLYEILSLAYGNPEVDPVTAVLTARLAQDTDGNRNIQGFYPFTSLDDARKNAATERLYTAYLEFRPRDTGVTIRAGRQTLDEFPESVPMDGAYVRYQVMSEVAVAVFGGLPVNLFEPSPSGDAMYGASAEWVPEANHRARYRVEYLHLQDDNIVGLHRDDLVGFSLEEGAGPFNVYARYTLLEGESRDLVGRLTGAVPDAEFLFQVQATYSFHRIEALSYAIDPYATFMMDLEPYLDIQLRASKAFGGVVALDAVFTSRQIVRDGVETTYNHEFKRVEIAPIVRPSDRLSVRVSADYWNSSADDFWTVSGDLSWTVHRDIVLCAGSAYALYSIDAFTGEEHDRVRTYTVSVKWAVSKGSTLEARFTYENNDIDNFRILEFGFRHAF